MKVKMVPLFCLIFCFILTSICIAGTKKTSKWTSPNTVTYEQVFDRTFANRTT